MFPEELISIILSFFNLTARTPGNDIIFQSAGNDIILGRTGDDVLLGVDPGEIGNNAGDLQIDVLIGGPAEPIEAFDGLGTTVAPDADLFVLGDGLNPYYAEASLLDFAIVADFNSDADIIRLNGSSDDYRLREINIPFLGASFSVLFRNEGNDLISVIAGDSDLSLTADYFEYVSEPPPSEAEVALVQQIGSPGADFAFDVAADSEGNVTIVGGTSGELGSENEGGNDAWIAQYNSSGSLNFIQQFGTPESETNFSVAIDSNGEVFVSGVTSGDLGGENEGGNDAWIAKFDSDGNQMFIDQIGTESLDNTFEGSLSIDSADNVVLGGYTQGSLGGTNEGETDPFLVKFDNSGNQIWTQQFGTDTFDELFGTATDLDNNVIATGWTIGDLGGTNAGLYDAWIAKFDSDGNQLWIEQLGTGDYDFAYGTATDSEGNVYATGFTLGDLGGSNAGEYDAWVAKYEPDGDQLWVQQFGSTGTDTPFGIEVNEDDNILVTGYTSGTLADGSSAGEDDAWIAQLDSDGNILNTVQFGSAGDDRSQGIAIGPDSIFVAGFTDGSLGSGNAGSYDPWVAQLSTDLALQDFVA
ncbi:MAG: SBBP repeat-containing protein [Synechococcus sp.]